MFPIFNINNFVFQMYALHFEELYRGHSCVFFENLEKHILPLMHLHQELSHLGWEVRFFGQHRLDQSHLSPASSRVYMKVSRLLGPVIYKIEKNNYIA